MFLFRWGCIAAQTETQSPYFFKMICLLFLFVLEGVLHLEKYRDIVFYLDFKWGCIAAQTQTKRFCFFCFWRGGIAAQRQTQNLSFFLDGVFCSVHTPSLFFLGEGVFQRRHRHDNLLIFWRVYCSVENPQCFLFFFIGVLSAFFLKKKKRDVLQLRQQLVCVFVFFRWGVLQLRHTHRTLFFYVRVFCSVDTHICFALYVLFQVGVYCCAGTDTEPIFSWRIYCRLENTQIRFKMKVYCSVDKDTERFVSLYVLFRVGCIAAQTQTQRCYFISLILFGWGVLQRRHRQRHKFPFFSLSYFLLLGRGVLQRRHRHRAHFCFS